MSDFVTETPYIALRYCPACEPKRDPLKEILEVLWCPDHQPETGGRMDHVTTPSAYISGGGEAGGDDNRRWCDRLHRGAS